MAELIGYEYSLEDTIRIPESQLSDFLEEENVVDYVLVDDYDIPDDSEDDEQEDSGDTE